MDLFPHDKLTTYLANRPNFPPSPQVLSLKEESSIEVKDPEMREGGRRVRADAPRAGRKFPEPSLTGRHTRFHDDWDISIQIFSRTVLQSDIPRNP